MSKVSIIILNYNGFEESNKLMSEFMRWDPSQLDYNIVLVDNFSKDDSYFRLQEEFGMCERVDVIRSEKNGGYSYGNNYGVRFAISHYHPEYIAIANPDVMIDQKTMCSLLETFDEDEKIGMCAPVMTSIDGSYQICALKLPEYRDDLIGCRINSKPLNRVVADYKTLGSNDNFIISEMLPGSFFLIRTDVFVKVGMFDESVFLFCEERILGKKLKDAGFFGIIRSDLFFVHAHSTSIKKAMSMVQTWKLILSSRLYYEQNYLNTDTGRLLYLSFRMKLFLCELWALALLQNLRERGMGKTKD